MKRCTMVLLGVLIPLTGAAQERAFLANDRAIFGTPEDLTASVVFADVDGDQIVFNRR